MTSDSPKVEFVDGQAVTQRRGILWAVGGRGLDAKQVFEGLAPNHEAFLRDSMKAWIDGAQDIATRFHGFPNDPSFKDGYVFKWREKRVQHRIYGFKMRPGLPTGNFETCVLAMHSTKDTDETSPWMKKAIYRLRDDDEIRAAVLAAVKKQFGLNAQEARK